MIHIPFLSPIKEPIPKGPLVFLYFTMLLTLLGIACIVFTEATR